MSGQFLRGTTLDDLASTGIGVVTEKDWLDKLQPEDLGQYQRHCNQAPLCCMKLHGNASGQNISNIF